MSRKVDCDTMISRRRVFLIGWEFPGFNTKQGTALAKRLGALHNGFRALGESVIIITKNHHTDKLEKHGEIYLVPGPGITTAHTFSLIRKISTFFYVLFFGDKSGIWGLRAFQYASRQFGLQREDIVVSFFTPRGPVLAGYLLKKKYNVRWLVDFQDPFDEGLGSSLFSIGKFWFRKIVRRADACVHVSPEWAARDGRLLLKQFIAIRHSLPVMPEVIRKSNISSSKKKLLYYGSFDAKFQYHNFFFNYIKEHDNCEFLFAGLDRFDHFFRGLQLGENYRYLGWLTQHQLVSAFERVDLMVIFSYSLQNHPIVPSKLYEIIAANLPCIIIGEDTGGIKSLEEEFGYTFNKATNESELEGLMVHSENLYRVDYSRFGSLRNENFITKYQSVIEQL